MKTTKDQARQEIDTYGALLQERAVISDIESEEVRGEQHYMFRILDSKFPSLVECVGIKELALVLNVMWSSYMKARNELFIDEAIAF